MKKSLLKKLLFGLTALFFSSQTLVAEEEMMMVFTNFEDKGLDKDPIEDMKIKKEVDDDRLAKELEAEIRDEGIKIEDLSFQIMDLNMGSPSTGNSKGPSSVFDLEMQTGSMDGQTFEDQASQDWLAAQENLDQTQQNLQQTTQESLAMAGQNLQQAHDQVQQDLDQAKDEVLSLDQSLGIAGGGIGGVLMIPGAIGAKMLLSGTQAASHYAANPAEAVGTGLMLNSMRYGGGYMPMHSGSMYTPGMAAQTFRPSSVRSGGDFHRSSSIVDYSGKSGRKGG